MITKTSKYIAMYCDDRVSFEIMNGDNLEKLISDSLDELNRILHSFNNSDAIYASIKILEYYADSDNSKTVADVYVDICDEDDYKRWVFKGKPRAVNYCLYD